MTHDRRESVCLGVIHIIATKLSQSNYIQTINLKIPGISDGSIIRFTFDNVASAKDSKLYIEGVFNLENYSLENVEYHGMVSTSGSTIKGEVEDIFINFTFEGVHTDDNVLIKSDFTDEWIYVFANGGIWQKNSEFDKKENSEIVTKRSSAAIMLVLDCSSSLGDQFANVQSNAKGFIKTLYEAAGLNNDDPANPEKPDVTIYSTTPKDLSLAIWKDGTRYYLTEEQYKTANLSGASIEGLTVLSNMGNFIISLHNLQSNTTEVKYALKYYENLLPDKDQATVISARYSDINRVLKNFIIKLHNEQTGTVLAETAMKLYLDILPDKDQAEIISLKYSDINSALEKFGGNIFDSSHYLTKTSYDSGSNYTLYLSSHTGGGLGTYFEGYIRGVKTFN